MLVRPRFSLDARGDPHPEGTAPLHRISRQSTVSGLRGLLCALPVRPPVGEFRLVHEHSAFEFCACDCLAAPQPLCDVPRWSVCKPAQEVPDPVVVGFWIKPTLPDTAMNTVPTLLCEFEPVIRHQFAENSKTLLCAFEYGVAPRLMWLAFLLSRNDFLGPPLPKLPVNLPLLLFDEIAQPRRCPGERIWFYPKAIGKPQYADDSSMRQLQLPGLRAPSSVGSRARRTCTRVYARIISSRVVGSPVHAL